MLYNTGFDFKLHNMTCLIYLGQESGGNDLAEQFLRIMWSQQIEQVYLCLLLHWSEPNVYPYAYEYRFLVYAG